jgi:hypothetical protein
VTQQQETARNSIGLITQNLNKKRVKSEIIL